MKQYSFKISSREESRKITLGLSDDIAASRTRIIFNPVGIFVGNIDHPPNGGWSIAAVVFRPESLTQNAASKIKAFRATPSSCPGLSRASTSFAPQTGKTWMGRANPAHNKNGSYLNG